MKIVVVSDCHRDVSAIRNIAQREYDADMYLMLGDSELDEETIRPFVSIKGNCDYFSNFPLEKIIKTPFGNILMEHGHLHDYVSPEYVKERGCRFFLYGHTHCHSSEEIDGIYFLNPGSTSRPRDRTNGTYLVMYLEENLVKLNFVLL